MSTIMTAVNVASNIYWVGAIDWDIRHFHGQTYNTNHGTTYNSYLIIDDKITLVDAVQKSFAKEMLERISEIIPPEKIDYIVVNHIEPDHSGALTKLMEICPNAKMYGSAKSKDGLLKTYHKKWDFTAVKTGDTLSLGKNTLQFIEAPMIHWPDSMFTYLQEQKILLSNDAFGQHYASSERFDDEADETVFMDEASKYYANILWPLGSIISKKLAEIGELNIPINMICPSHGLIFRKNHQKIINTYQLWTENKTKPKAVVLFETMWGSTELMARKIAEGISSEGVSVTMYDISKDDRTQIVNEMFEAKGYCIGSSTHDNDMLPTLAGFMHFLKGLKPKNRIGSVFGSYGWAGGAIKGIEEMLVKTGVEIVQLSLGVPYVPDAKQEKKCIEFGREFAQKIKKL
ncbi:MAG: FprA family A-type flavoprotein [bacterium]